MSRFSESFKKLIQEKDINVYSMVQSCNTDRSTMYKYISGKRKLKDFTLFQKITEFIRLSPQEYRAFLEDYHINNIGEYAYYCRQNVEDFILAFPENLSPPRPPALSYAPQPAQAAQAACTPLYTQTEVNDHLHWMILQESHVPDGHLGMLLQPDCEFLFHLLASLKPAQTPLRIDHVFCLDNSEQLTDRKKIRRLLYLEKILPLLFAGLDYAPHYFYDDVNAHFYNLNMFPYLLLTSTGALMCSPDFRQGIVYHDADTLKFLWRSYEDMKKNTSPLFHIVDSVLDECNALGDMGWGLAPCYVVQAEPCLIPYITPETLGRALHSQIPGRDALMDELQKYITDCQLRIANPNMHIYHTRQGIGHFLKTGRLQEIPSDIYTPFTMEERLQMLADLARDSQSGTHHMLQGPLAALPLNLHLSFNLNSGYILFSDHTGKNIYLIIQESSTLSAFIDYISTLDESYICSPQETAACIRQLMDGFMKRSMKDSMEG